MHVMWSLTRCEFSRCALVVLITCYALGSRATTCSDVMAPPEVLIEEGAYASVNGRHVRLDRVYAQSSDPHVNGQRQLIWEHATQFAQPLVDGRIAIGDGYNVYFFNNKPIGNGYKYEKTIFIDSLGYLKLKKMAISPDGNTVIGAFEVPASGSQTRNENRIFVRKFSNINNGLGFLTVSMFFVSDGSLRSIQDISTFEVDNDGAIVVAEKAGQLAQIQAIEGTAPLY